MPTTASNKPSNTASTPLPPELSVVVTTSGRVDLLDRCLDALLRQGLERRRYEIIVVDVQPRMKTRQLVAVWNAGSTGSPPIVYLAAHGTPAPPGPAAARNLGWRRARAPIIAFTDEDTVPAPGWLQHALAAFGEHVDALCGRVDQPIDGNAAAPRRPRTSFRAANCFCRRTLLERLDGFDERFHLAWHDDADLYFRLLGAGAHIVHATQVVVVQPPRPGSHGGVAHTRKAVFDALLFKKHPRLYRETIGPSPHWNDLATVAALLLAAGGLVLGSTVLAGAGAAPWTLLTAHASARRLRGGAHGPGQIAGVLLGSALIPPLAVYWRLAGAWRYRVRFA